MKAIRKTEYTLVTPRAFNDQEALDMKMKQIHPKLFGLFCPVKYRLVQKTKVQIPYMFLVFEYRLIRGSDKALDKRGIFDREGKIGVVFDMNEVHPFHFDLYDDLKLEKCSTAVLDGIIMPDNCTEQEAVDQSIECVKWQYLKRVLHAIPQVTLVKKQRFYREAWKLDLDHKGKEYEKYAYKDNFGAQNEHITGLKVRLDI